MVRGRCLCGDVAFEVTGDIGMVMHCHCSMCRKFHGSAFATHGVVPTDGFGWRSSQDSIRRYVSSPGGARPFCRRCGSNVPSDHLPGVVVIPLGNLDDDPGARPLAHIFAASKARWYDVVGDLPRYDVYPPGIDAMALPDPVREPAATGYVRGSCLCGRVAYDIEGTIDRIHHCHCSRCRRARSAAHASNGFVDSARFRILHGEDLLESYKLPEAERFTQTFCRECGSVMPRTRPQRPYVVIPMGSIDGEPGVRPRAHIFVGSKALWYEIADALPQYAEYAPE
ncbi:MAG TPA: GFA family protein [Candidatus Binatia bacterium]|nr:GFA family protein [Candidatus Binatia bacterium]